MYLCFLPVHFYRVGSEVVVISPYCTVSVSFLVGRSALVGLGLVAFAVGEQWRAPEFPGRGFAGSEVFRTAVGLWLCHAMLLFLSSVKKPVLWNGSCVVNLVLWGF